VTESAISHGYALPKDEREWREIVKDVLDRKSRSYVGAAVVLAQFAEASLNHRERLQEALATVASSSGEDREAAIKRATELARTLPT
jgi:hypothetical protein